MLHTKAKEAPLRGTNNQATVSHPTDTIINQHPSSPHVPSTWTAPILNPATQSRTQVLQWAHIFPSSTSDGISTIQRAEGHCHVTGRLGMLQASEGHVPSCSGKRLQMANTTPLGGWWALS